MYAVCAIPYEYMVKSYGVTGYSLSDKGEIRMAQCWTYILAVGVAKAEGCCWTKS